MNMSNQELSDTLEDVINNTKIFDIHTHLFPSTLKVILFLVLLIY